MLLNPSIPAMLVSRNPYNNEIIYKIEELSEIEIESKLEQGNRVFNQWRKIDIKERCMLLLKLAQVLFEEKEILAETISLEMGKPISQSIAEIEKCAWLCNYYAAEAPLQLEPVRIKTDADLSLIRFDPLGIILGIMPWNYPFWQVFRFAVPTLTAGNGVVLKHASNVSKCGILIAGLFEKAGYPKAIFQFFPIKNDTISSILENAIIRGVSLTGSTPAGSAVGSLAGKFIKKSVLELGGNNALVVFEDAKIEETVATCLQARFQNTGQSCIAGKRLLIHESIAEQFIKILIEKVKLLESGDPLSPITYIGVMAREDLAMKLELQMQESIAKGAKKLCGGERKGAYFEPTVLSLVTPGMPVFDEETFGPLLGITTFKTEDEAIELISKSNFGLGVSLFTKSKERVWKMIPEMDEGAVFVNDLVKSDPRLPFGGVKISGYGRELSKEGILEFVNKKTVYQKF